MDVGLKRVLLVVLSLVGGVVGMLGVIGLIKLAFDPLITFERYGSSYAVLTALPLSLLIAVWLDYFLGTGLLPNENPMDVEEN